MNANKDLSNTTVQQVIEQPVSKTVTDLTGVELSGGITAAVIIALIGAAIAFFLSQ